MTGHLQRKILNLGKEGNLTSYIFTEFYGSEGKRESDKFIRLGWIKPIERTTNPIKYKLTPEGEHMI